MGIRMVRVLLLGGTGMLGQAIRRIFPECGLSVYAPSRFEFDLTSEMRAWNFGDACLIINAAVQKDAQAADAFIVNTEAPHHLGERAAAMGRQLIHLSTDALFNASGGPFYEDSPTSPANAYALQKAKGEPSDKALVIRTSIIGPEDPPARSLLGQVFSARGTPYCAYTNHVWTGVTSIALAAALGRYCAAWDGEVRAGVRHVPSDVAIDKAALLSRIAKGLGRPEAVTVTAAPTSSDRRLATRFPAFLEELGLPPLDWQLEQLIGAMTPQAGWRI